MNIFKIYSLMLVFIPAITFSNTWADRISTCDEARLEIICRTSFDGYTKCRYQFYIESEYAKNFFVNNGLISYNRHYEVLLPELRTISGSSDMIDNSMAYRHNGRVYYLKPCSSGSYKVEVFRTSQPTGGIYTQKEQLGEYFFHNCK